MNDPIPTSDQNTVKPCRKCGAADRYSDGECRPCARATAKKRYQENKDAELARTKAWREKNPNYGKEWHLANLEKHQQQCREWHIKNPDKSKSNRIAWKAENKSRIRERERQWRIENPEEAKRRDQNRRALKKANGGKLSKDIVNTLMKLQKGLCACCGKPLGNKYHLDHIMPLALGGANTDDNVQLLLPQCNWSKGGKHPIEYMRAKGKLL